MLSIFKNSFSLLFGIFLLMVGYGLQGTLLGIRGDIEGYSAATMSYIMSAYMIGFLFGGKVSSFLISKVGHVRVFAALASLISAVFICFALFVDPYLWFLFRLLIGFCFSGVFVVTESWLNEESTNTNRGKTMSVYIIIQTLGIFVSQIFINFADPSTFILFGFISIIVSISFAPILLSVGPTPVYSSSSPMSLLNLLKVSPFATISIVMLGAILSLLFSMTAVFGSQMELSVKQISVLMAIFFLSGMLMQYPIGFFSDKYDRRVIVIILSIFGFIFSFFGFFFLKSFDVIVIIFLIIGAASNPIYSVLIAHTNDYLKPKQMASASAGLIFLLGLGGVLGPLIAGQLMNFYGPEMFLHTISIFFFIIILYGSYRVYRKPLDKDNISNIHTTIIPQSRIVALEAVKETSENS